MSSHFERRQNLRNLSLNGRSKPLVSKPRSVVSIVQNFACPTILGKLTVGGLCQAILNLLSGGLPAETSLISKHLRDLSEWSNLN